MTSARRSSQIAISGFVAVLLALSGFALWSTQTTAAAARRAVAASVLSDHYQQAMTSLLQEELWEQTELVKPEAVSKVRFDAAANAMSSAMLLVARDGGTTDRATSERVLALHRPQVQSVHQMFAAVDRHDTVAANLIVGQLEPGFAAISQLLSDAAGVQYDKSQRALVDLRQRVYFTGSVRPAVLAAGIVLMLLLSLVLQRVRRQLYRQREEALRESLHDPLTGLANRALLAERFDEALRHSRGEGGRTGLLLLDLDRFKEINDTLGHHYGDQLLTQIGPRVQSALRPEDTIARLGGDEFAVLLPDVAGLEAALLVAEKLRYALTAPFTVDRLELAVEASIGVVVSGEHGDDPSTLLQHADIAMYVAKKQNLGVFPYDPDTDGHTPQKLTLLSDLRRALERHELLLHYQPKMSLSTGDVCGVEALVRWQHPQRGLLSPDQFIPLAEHTGLIGPLTDYVLDAALTDIRTWTDTGLEVRVAVNLSTRNLLDPGLAGKVADLLRHHALPAAVLELEVTESALMTEPIRARQTLARLHDLGIRIAIDDFGVGYSNLSQLKLLPVTELKIDRSFVTTMDTDTGNAHIVKSVVDLSHNLGITTIAEGVETEATMAALRLAGCDVVQGYYVAAPMCAAELATWLDGYSGRSRSSASTIVYA